MSIEQELYDFYQRHGFGEDLGKRRKTVSVYTGCILVPVPNIETRRRYLKYHDLHHLITGYSVGRIGEGEISAWELGTGTVYLHPMLGIMNMIALSTGLVLKPKRMWQAFQRGCKSCNLYSSKAQSEVDSGRWDNISEMRECILEIRNKSPGILRSIEFGVFSSLAMLIHVFLAIPAVILRFITDTFFGGGIIEAVKPKKRTDLY